MVSVILKLPQDRMKYGPAPAKESNLEKDIKLAFHNT